MKRLFFWSLRRRLWLVIFLTVVPPFGLILYTHLELRRLETFDMRQDALQLARLVVSEQKCLIDGARHLLIALAHAPEARSGDAAACSALAARLLQGFRQYTTPGAAQPNGDVFCSSVLPPDPVNLAAQADFHRVLQRRDFTTTGYLVGPITGKPVLGLGYPFVDASGAVQAVVFIGLDLAWIEQRTAETTLPRSSAFYQRRRHAHGAHAGVSTLLRTLEQAGGRCGAHPASDTRFARRRQSASPEWYCGHALRGDGTCVIQPPSSIVV